MIHDDLCFFAFAECVNKKKKLFLAQHSNDNDVMILKDIIC